MRVGLAIARFDEGAGEVAPLRGREEVHQRGQPLVGARLEDHPVERDDEKDRQHPRLLAPVDEDAAMVRGDQKAEVRGRRRDDDGERRRAKEEHLHQLQRQEAQEQRAAVVRRDS